MCRGTVFNRFQELLQARLILKVFHDRTLCDSVDRQPISPSNESPLPGKQDAITWKNNSFIEY
jgi:hypothetical protein